jgi:hypothetical protein
MHRCLAPIEPGGSNAEEEDTAMTQPAGNGATPAPAIDWRMSAALENVLRGSDDLPEVTSLEGAVRAWLELDPERRRAATLTPEHPLVLDGAKHASCSSELIARLAKQLPPA